MIGRSGLCGDADWVLLPFDRTHYANSRTDHIHFSGRTIYVYVHLADSYDYGSQVSIIEGIVSREI